MFFPEFVGSFPKYYVNILVFNGLFGVIIYLFKGINMCFDLWIMSEGVQPKRFKIESISRVVHPLGFGKNGELFFRHK